MGVDLDAIKINEQGIPCNVVSMGRLFGQRYDEFGHGEILRYLSAHVERASFIERRDQKWGKYDFECWEITKELAQKMYKYLNPTDEHGNKYHEWDYEMMLSYDWEDQFEGGKVYVYWG